MKMFCCFCNVFSSCFITNSTSISFYACLCTCRFFSDYSLIPTMIFCFCNSIAWWKFSSTVRAIFITGISFLFTGSFLLISNFRVEVLCCIYANFFNFCIITNSAGISSFAFHYTGWNFCNYSTIPMIITVMYNYCCRSCWWQSVQWCG